MHALRILIGMVFVLTGLLLLAPVLMLVWATFAYKVQSGSGHETFYTYTKLFIGGFSFTGFQMWLVLGILALTGFTLLMAGVYVMTAKKW
jgi:hypothetical protein